MAASQRVYCFGPFRLKEREQILLRKGERIPLAPKACQLLMVLVANPGKVLDKDFLLSAVWPGASVEEGNLTKGVFQLRRALESNEAGPFIETLPKRGYRFLHPVDLQDGAREIQAWNTQPAIAVLPFANLSGDAREEALCEGLAEAILDRLSGIPGLRVVARTSSFQFKANGADIGEIAAQMRATAVLDGSARKSRSQWRITARLIDAASGSPLWSSRYDRREEDVFDVQDDIATAVASALNVRFTPGVAGHRASDMRAYERYLEGRYLWNRRPGEVDRALECFQEALERDHGFAPAYAGIADVYRTLGSWEAAELPPGETLEKAKQYAEQAIDLDPRLAEAWTTLAYTALHYDWRFGESEQRFQKALEVNPSCTSAHHGYAQCLMVRGKVEEALAHSQMALLLDPLNPRMKAHMAWHHHMARQAQATIERALEVVQRDACFPWGHYFLGWGYEQAQQYDTAVAAFEEAARHSGENPVMLAGLGRALALNGDRMAARRILSQLRVLAMGRGILSCEIALIHAPLGEMEEACQLLAQAREERSGWIAYLCVDPRFDAFRADPRFAALVPVEP